MTNIAIDARMVLSSGIGTVIANVLQRLIIRNPYWNFQLVGDAKVLRGFSWAIEPNVRIVEFTAPIYTVAEQIGFPIAALEGSSLLWSPNYQAPLRWRKKLLVTVHDLAHLVLPEMRNSLLKQFYVRSMFARLRRHAGAIAYVSQFTADEFHRLLGAPKGREFVIPCGVDEAWFDIPRGEPPARRYILFVGNVKPHKNLSRLLDAFDRIRGELPHHLLIAGRKEGFITGDQAVLTRIREFEGRVAFTGYLPDLSLKQLYAGADALVMPSLYEGFGLPPVEAMAVGCPALVSRTASLPEVCRDAALYCDPLDVADIASKLRQILTDDDLRQGLKKRGLARAHELDWAATTEGYERAIKSLLA